MNSQHCAKCMNVVFTFFSWRIILVLSALMQWNACYVANCLKLHVDSDLFGMPMKYHDISCCRVQIFL